MKLLEKFRTQPAWQSDDPLVRLEAIRGLPDDVDAEDALIDLVRSDSDLRVRFAAVERIKDLGSLTSLLRDETIDDDIRAAAAVGIREVVVKMSDEREALLAISLLDNEHDLSAVARTADSAAIGLSALKHVTSDKTLSAVARKTKHVSVALEAIRRIATRSELLAIATKTDDKVTALAAYERLVSEEVPDVATLDEIVRRARQKGVSRRARALLDNQEVSQVNNLLNTTPTAAVSLCNAVEQLVDAVTDLEEGRRALDTIVEAWAALEESTESSVTERFMVGRRSVEDRLLALDAVRAEEQRATKQRVITESMGEALCVRVEEFHGSDVLEELKKARAEWHELEMRVGSEIETVTSFTRLAKRFEDAAATCEQRHLELKAVHTRIQRLEAVVVELEELETLGDRATVGKARKVLESQWRSEITELDSSAKSTDMLTVRRERKVAVDKRHRILEADKKEAREQTVQRNLTRLQNLITAVDRCVQDEKLTLSDAERQLRKARQELDTLPPLPTRNDREEITRKLRACTVSLLGKVRELRDFADWQRWANLGIQESLCLKMEALASPPEGVTHPSIAEVAQVLRDLMKQWRAAAEVPWAKGQPLWQRFKKAHDIVYSECESFFTAQKAEKEKILSRQLALVDESEKLSESTDWARTAKRLTELQAEWKELGSAHNKGQRKLWDRFRLACSTFFVRRKAVLAERRSVWADNIKQKKGLCERVEALIEAKDVPSAVKEVKCIQAEWKKIGPVRRKLSDGIWERFRVACDSVFDRVNEGERKVFAKRIAEREAICVELEALLETEASPNGSGGELKQITGAGPNSVKALADRVREIQTRWREEFDVPLTEKRKLSARFGQTIARLVEKYPDQFRGTDLDPTRKLKQLEALCKRAEALVPSEVLDEGGASPAEILAKKWREQLASNTMGTVGDESAKHRVTLAEVKRLQAEYRRLSLPAGPDVEKLRVRFRQACDRAIQKKQAITQAS